MKRICEKHGTPMSLWDSDRSGQTWMCGECLVEVSKELSRALVIEELEKLIAQPPKNDEPLVGRMLNVPASILKLALRQLRAPR